MKYVSTRGYGAAAPLRFTDILLEGLAPDGGLYVPQTYPRLSASDLAELVSVLSRDGYQTVAARVLGLYADDIPAADLAAMTARAYTAAAFSSAAIVPVRRLESGLILGALSEGPTAAFKDLAMAMLAQLFDYELARRDQYLTVLGATSGDTGSSAEVAMLGTARVQVFMLSPQGRMTPFQRGQMYGIDSPRIVNVVVPGTFDDCQDLVKAVNTDAAFKARYAIGAINSINWARLAAQVVYYVVAWARATGGTGPVSVTVPTGNFGNILAGHVARRMGVPIRHLVLATNENNVLADFFDSGVYRVRSSAETLATSSPSMDISRASNLERFLYDAAGDPAWVRQAFGHTLAATGVIDVTREPWGEGVGWRQGFVAGTSRHADRLATIADVWHRDGYLLDPHTADGVTVARAALAGRLAGYAPGGEPMVVMETALPVKFADTIRQATGLEPPTPTRFAGVVGAPAHVVDLTGGTEQLKQIIAERSIWG